MPDSVTARYRWTVDEILTAYRWHSRRRHFLLRSLPWVVGIGFLTSGLVFLVVSGVSSAVSPVLFGSLLLLLVGVLQPWVIRRQFAKRPDRDSDVEWQIAPDKIRTQHSHGTSEFIWSALSSVVQTPEGFLFYTSPQMFHWVPRHGLAGDADFERLSEIARHHAAKFQIIA